MRERALRLALAENPALPGRLVSRLIDGADEDLADRLAGRADLDRAQVLALAGQSDDVAAVLAGRGLLEAEAVDPLDRPYTAMVLIEEGRGREEWAVAFADDPETKWRVLLAACPRLPARVNLLLAADPDFEVVTELACFTTESDLLARLAGHPCADVRAAVASNPATPPPVLAELVTQRSGTPSSICVVCARESVPFVHDPNCPRLDCELPPGAECDGTHQFVIHNLLVKAVDNSATPVDALAGLTGHPSIFVRWALAGRADLPAADAEILAADQSAGVRAAAAAHPGLSEATIRRLSGDGNGEVRWRVARNPSVPLDVLAGLGRINSGRIPPRIADAGPDEVRELAASPSPQLRMLLAERRDLPPEVRDRLARDPDAKVLKAVAPHPGLSEELLRDMVSRHGARVIVPVAVNPDASAGLLFDLARHLPPVPKVFREIAGRADAPAEVLELCLADPRARPIAAAHPALPPDRIVELLADGDDRVAAAAAANPALPVSEMFRLLGPVP
ncbi:MAG TPA: hypothetical protein VN408_13500 [Actinoplanes sp.]|nr:hypothetical protein [Actinoplanes sp.]